MKSLLSKAFLPIICGLIQSQIDPTNDCLDAVAHGFGSVCGTSVRTCLDAKREWGEPLLAALPPQDRNGALTLANLIRQGKRVPEVTYGLKLLSSNDFSFQVTSEG